MVDVRERRSGSIIDPRKVRAVARFELAEALRSRLVLMVLAVVLIRVLVGARVLSRREAPVEG